MVKTNTRGDIQLHPVYLRPDLHRHIKDQAKKRKLSVTTIVNEALQMHFNKKG